MTIRVINALVHLVHGRRGMEDSKQFKDHKKFNDSFSDLLKLTEAAYTEKEYQDNSISNGMWSR